MSAKYLLLALCLVTIQSVVSETKHVPYEWTPLDWEDIPKALPDDKIEFWYLRAPLLEQELGDWLEVVNLYHGAIGFNNTRTGEAYTLNYDAFNFFKSSMFPNITMYDNGSRSLTWINGGASFVYAGINMTWWFASHDIVATINGTMFNNYLSMFNAEINATYPYYNMVSILSEFGAKPYVPSWDCFDFVWASFNWVYENGGELNYSLHLKRNFVNVYSSVPIDYTDLYYSDLAVQAEIIDFYAFIEIKYSDLSWYELMSSFMDVFDGVFFVRSNTQYFKCQLQYPYLAADFDELPLPGQP